MVNILASVPRYLKDSVAGYLTIRGSERGINQAVQLLKGKAPYKVSEGLWSRTVGLGDDFSLQIQTISDSTGDILDTEDKDEDSFLPSGDVGSIDTSKLDPWSLVWYIGSFGGLVTFFLVVSCSECCCKRRQAAAASTAAQEAAEFRVIEDPPPPPYEMFAPPPYDSLFYGEKKDRLEIFVVPVHVSAPPPPT
uniref:Uncharacterized protein n=1 Tax=Timema shepardi TaxID=629360 RepID=A0A7R9B247_TIMSH|nr:unnamed protein product [Timema shepardi]